MLPSKIKLLSAIGLLVHALVGCSVTPATAPPAQAYPQSHLKLSDGAWIGPIPITGMLADDTKIGKDGLPLSRTSTFLVTVCDGQGIFWKRNDDGGFHAAAREKNFGNHSNLQNHLIYFENHDDESKPSPTWIETQAMVLIELGQGDLRVQWSRAVNNPLLPQTDRDRNFFWNGVGTLKRVASECPRELMKSKVND